jgi:uncharacterized protein
MPTPWYRDAALTCLTLAAAAAVAFFFAWMHVPLAYILGAMVGAMLIGNLLAPMKGARQMRRFSQLFVGASVGAVMDASVLDALWRLFPLMVATAIGANLLGFLLVVPVARLAGIDRLTALLSCLPAGMAEMATLAHEVKADEQSVAIIHTLRIVIVLTLVPVWLLAIGHPVVNGPLLAAPESPTDLLFLACLITASLVVGIVATRLRVINAYIVVPTLLSMVLIGFGLRIPAVPGPLMVAAQIGIGASVGLRFRFDKMRRLPRTVFGGVVSGLALVSMSVFGLGFLIERFGGLDHLSALLAAAPGGLGEMIATANALGVAAATVAGFHLTRSVFTNVFVASLIRWHQTRRG